MMPALPTRSANTTNNSSADNDNSDASANNNSASTTNTSSTNNDNKMIPIPRTTILTAETITTMVLPRIALSMTAADNNDSSSQVYSSRQ